LVTKKALVVHDKEGASPRSIQRCFTSLPLPTSHLHCPKKVDAWPVPMVTKLTYLWDRSQTAQRLPETAMSTLVNLEESAECYKEM
jgi:hypothetical protein